VERLRIAIADDHALVREGLARLLSQTPGIEVVATVTDAASAMAYLADHAPDVLLLDLAMPGMDGLSAIPALCEACPETRILVLSMYDEPEIAAEAINRGACGLVSKAACTEALVDAIRRVARGERLSAGPVLSPREREVLTLIGEGQGNDRIAALLGLSEKTVAHHRERLMEKLDVHTQAGLVAYARRAGLSGAD
jgi:DNA-binding NarL/FixJ family response regulator